jgi:HSP20 family protein
MRLMKRRPEFADEPLMRLRHQINRMFDTDWDVGDFFGGWNPPVDILEDKDRLTVKAELPGFKREEIEVSLHENNLILSGERNYEDEKTEGQLYRSERYYGKFHRSIALPFAVDQGKIQAKYRDGILTVSLPKSEKAKAKQIEVAVE